MASIAARLRRTRPAAPPGSAGPPPSMESLAAIRAEVQRDRLLDMEDRLKRYRVITFGILAAALVAMASDLGWWWLLPLTAGLGAFALADRRMHSSARPAIWIAAAWALTPLLVAGAVAATDGPHSPLVVWFAIPAVTLGARFEPRQILIGTAYLIVCMGACTLGIDTNLDTGDRESLIVAFALVLSAVVLSGALVESDRAHRRRSTLDPLTGLFNRNALEQRLRELDGQTASRAEGMTYALLLCDLDHFKRVNDELGHAVGDAVLQDVAYTMRAALRGSDSMYRVGGEEILVVLPGSDESDAREIAERLCGAVRERHPAGVRVTVSIGVAISPDGVISSEALVERADGALYAAKDTGRDRVCVADAAPRFALT